VETDPPTPLEYAPPAKRKRRSDPSAFWLLLLAGWLLGAIVGGLTYHHLPALEIRGDIGNAMPVLAPLAIVPTAIIAGVLQYEWPGWGAILGFASTPIAMILTRIVMH
jgi:hypothetical protein